MKKLVKKLLSARGFTLAETLICVLILLMVAGIVGAGIPAASNAFTKAVDAANAQVLMSTTITVLRNELSTATEVQPGDDGKTITYRSGSTGSSSKLECDADGKSIIVTTTYGYDGFWEEAEEEETKPKSVKSTLVSAAASTKNLSISLSDITKANGVLSVKVTVNMDRQTAPVAERTIKLRLFADKVSAVEDASDETPDP